MPYKNKEEAAAAKKASYVKHKESQAIIAKAKRENETEEERLIRLDYHKSHYANNKDYYATTGRANALKRKYGLTVEEYDIMLFNQDGKCAMCKEQKFANRSGTRLCVDHDHVTGKVRELLCDDCNLLLGHAKDNQDILLKAIEYLQKHKLVP